MSKLKILFLINTLGPGGAERSLAEMLPLMAESGIDPTVVCLSHCQEGVESQVRAHGFDVRYLESTRLSRRVRELRRMIKGQNPDLIQTCLFDSDVAGRLAAAQLGIPVITSLVNTSYVAVRVNDPNVRALRLGAAQLIDSWTARHLSTHFHAVTHAVKAAAVETMGIRADRITVIERGRDPARLGEPSPERRRLTRAKLGLSDDDEVLINVGRQEYQKGQKFLLEAVRMLSGERPRLVLLIAGRRGHSSTALEHYLAEAGLKERVRLLGYRDDVPDLLAAADLFVFPSLYEGLGGAVIEAMALGVPVIASNLDAIREVVEEGRSGVLVPPGLPRELADAIRHLLEDRSQARAFAARGREIFLERFTLDQSVRRLIEMYRHVADRRTEALVADRGSS